MKFNLTERKITAIILVLTLIILISPAALRWWQGNTTLMGEEAYYHLKLVKNANLLFQAEFFTLYDLVLFVFNQVIESISWSIILPILYGMGTVLLFNNFLRKFKLALKQKFFILLLLVLSPAFIYFFTFSSQYGLIVFLLILTITFLEIKSDLKYLAIMPILSLTFFDVLTTLMVVIFLLAYSWLKKERKMLYLAAGTLLAAILIQLIYPRPWTYELFLTTSVFADFFADLGSLKGISLFSLLLTVVGLSATWKERRIYYFAYPAIALLILIFVLVETQVIVYLNFMLAFFAGLGLVYLWEKNWRLNFLKTLSITLLLAGIIISTAAQINAASQLPPNKFIEESLIWLKGNSQPDKVVFSHPSKSFWIESMAERPAFLNPDDADYENKLNITQVIFYSRDLTLTNKLLEENQIKYIWIDAEMQKGQVWDEDDEGLLFLFRNPKFKNIYNQKGIEIWRFG